MSSVSGGQNLGRYLDDIAKKIQDAGTLRVGFLETATYGQENDGLPVAQVAFWNEYGTSRSPPRPFFRNMIAEKKSGWSLEFGNLMQRNNYDVTQVFNVMGQGIKDQLTESIVKYSEQPNSTVTLILKNRFPKGNYTIKDYYKAIGDAKKGVTVSGANNNPLIWSGTMQNSTGWDIE